MRTLVLVHVVAGTLSLLSGYVALYAAKGAGVHRRSGTLFVLAMLVMCVAGAFLAALRDNQWSVVNLAAAVTTAYLVVTSLVTVHRPPGWTRRVDAGLAALALALGLAMLALGTLAVRRGGSLEGVPAFPFFLFGALGTLGGAGDVRVLRSAALQGAARLTRHLWRMSGALLVAAMSFFFGQAKVIPKPIRIMPLLALPVLAVLVTLLYWLWRVRWKRSLRGVVTVRMAKAA